MGCPPDPAADRIGTIAHVAGRYAIHQYGERSARLIPAKNPASWTEAIELARAEREPVVLAVNSRQADGNDMSWLWDVEFERLAGGNVTVTGERATPLAVRLRYANVRFRAEPDPVLAITNSGPGRPNVLADYTAFQSIRARGRNGAQ
ncbi:hypothetical protein AOZ06_14775 [Kibdelosporangium phytohabitans]|uniref:Lipid II isoglutaminyl synthase (glutamine-hydrolyzing) subunit MurT C-terminal domain-containing protein n=1 Tax=Kibdelosporangium phytohabitans TaxID=860235 RepID=A0A0N9HXM4_9PSEU|nr:hypothetical protein AOZ06_14775 [Kibdelosporangium phytohabitans]